MTVTRRARSGSPAAPQHGGARHRWLLFLHQLPSRPSNLRVRTWRRLQQIGALPVKQAAYVLPDTPGTREDFEWLKAEIEAAGGQASVFAADAVDAWSSDALVEEFRRSRQAAYSALAADAERLLKSRARRGPAMAPHRALRQIKDRLAAVEQIDFFGSAGRDRVVTLVHQFEHSGREPMRPADPPYAAAHYRRRLWVTRPRPGIDRLASAWLIRRFIDPDARFGFVPDRGATPPDAVAFDMFGVEFTHRGECCTFETLCDLFRLQDRALPAIAAIVHDLDLKDGRFGAPEAAVVGLLVEGMRLTHPDDERLLAAGTALFEALYRAMSQVRGLRGPRPVADRQAPLTRPVRRKHR